VKPLTSKPEEASVSLGKNQRLIPHLNKVCKNPFCKIAVEEHTGANRCLREIDPPKAVTEVEECKTTSCGSNTEQKEDQPQKEEVIKALSKNPFLSKLTKSNPFEKSTGQPADSNLQSKNSESKPDAKLEVKNPFLLHGGVPFKKKDPKAAKAEAEVTPKKNPFDRVREYKTGDPKELSASSKKKFWFPNPFEKPAIKTEEEKLGT
jgi:hypothetical protein